MSPTDTDHDRESVERRLDAVERALSAEEPLERTDRLDELESRVVELEAAVQALRGYVGSVRAVNEEIELRADRALRKAEAVERNVAPERGADTDDDTDRTAHQEPDAGTESDGFGSRSGSVPEGPSDRPEDDQTAERATPLERLRERL